MSQLDRITLSCSTILSSPEWQKLWRAYSTAADPADEIIEQLHAALTTKNLPAPLLRFMHDMLQIEYKALSAASNANDPFLKNLEEALSYLQGEFLPDRKILPPRYRQILEVLERETAQTPIRPMRLLFGPFEHAWEACKKYAGQHPIWFSGLLIGVTGLAYFMNANIGGQTVYIDPTLVGLTDLDIGVTGTIENFETLATAADMNARFGCHNHFANLPQGLVNVLSDLGLKAEHCGAMQKTFLNAQQQLNDLYAFLKIPFDFLVKNPVESFGDMAFQNSPFSNAFKDAADYTQSLWHGFNRIENLIVHIPALTFCWISAHVAGSLNNAQMREIGTSIRDFFHRAVHSRPATYALATTLPMLPFIAQNGANTNMIWAALGGATAGHLGYNLMNRRGRGDHVRRMLSPAQKSLRRISENSRKISNVQKRCSTTSAWQRHRKTVLIGAGTLSAYAGVVFANMPGGLENIQNPALWNLSVTFSEMAGRLAGGIMVTPPAAAYTLLDDLPQHYAVAALGALGGGCTAIFARACGGIARGFKKVFSSPEP